MDWVTRLNLRRIFNNTIEAFGIEPAYDGKGWEYPLPKGGSRWKAFDSNAYPKYRWVPNKPESARYYHHQDWLKAIRAANGRVWIVSGEPDVWASYEAGIINVFSWYGEGAIPPTLVEDMQQIGVTEIRLVPDRDKAGTNFAKNITRLFAPTDITVMTHLLPVEEANKGGYDLGKAWIEYDKEYPFEEWLLALPLMDIPPDDPSPEKPKQDRADKPDANEDTKALYERWCLEVEDAAVAAWKITRETNHDEWSKKNFRSPERTDRNASCRWNYKLHGFKDFGPATEDFYNTAWVANRLGLRTWEQYKNDHLQNLPEWNGSLDAAPAAPDKPQYIFPDGMPWDIHFRLMGIHLLKLMLDEKIKCQHPAALVWYVWQIIGESMVKAYPQGFTIGDFVRACEDASLDLSRDTVQTGLIMLTEWGVVNCDDFNQIALNSKLVKKVAIWQWKYFKFHSIDVQAANFRMHYIRLLREDLFNGIPDNARPQVTGLTPEQADEWNKMHESLFAQYSFNRQETFRKLQAAWQDLNPERFMTEGYRTLPEIEIQPMKNAVTFRNLLIEAHYHQMEITGQPIKAADTEKLVGVTRATMASLREKNNVICLPTTKLIPTAKVKPRQRQLGLVIKDNEDKTSLLKDARIEKKLPKSDSETTTLAAYIATTADIERHKELSEVQRRRAFAGQKALERKKKREEFRLRMKIALPEPKKRRPARTTIPDQYSPEYILHQLQIFLGDEKMQTTRIDLDTGEIIDLTPQEIWQKHFEVMQIRKIVAESPLMVIEEMPQQPTIDELAERNWQRGQVSPTAAYHAAQPEPKAWWDYFS